MLTDEMEDHIKRSAREKALLTVMMLVIELAGIDRNLVRRSVIQSMPIRADRNEVLDLYDAAFLSCIDELLREPD